MGISDRKEREKQEMRKRIIAAAMEMFISEGYEKTSIRNIAEKIEYSPATIYLYYKDKDELFYGIQCEAFEKLGTFFAQAVTSKDPLERLKQLLHAYLRFGMENPDLYDLMFIIRSPMNFVEEHEKWEYGQNAFNFLINVTEACKGHLRIEDPRKAAMSVWAIGHGLISLDVRCRTKILELSKEENTTFLLATTEAFLQMLIK